MKAVLITRVGLSVGLLSIASAWSVTNRRQFCHGAAAATAAVTTAGVVGGGGDTIVTLDTPLYVAHAATLQEEASDQTKVLKGYQRLTYLLDHWDAETTVCGRSDNPYSGLCERTPIKVMEYLGFKDTNDPLFKMEKTLMRLQSLVVDPAQDDEYQIAMEKAVEAAEEGSGMAYVSSWGEANPGGGKDRVELFIERSKNNVISVRDSLATIIRILDIK